MAYYVTAIEEYPIYEPAEGGYYYTGTTIVWERVFQNRRKAKRYFNRCAKEFTYEFSTYGSLSRYDRDGCYMQIEHHTRYIGEGHRLRMSNRPYEERGYTPYQ